MWCQRGRCVWIGDRWWATYWVYVYTFIMTMTTTATTTSEWRPPGWSAKDCDGYLKTQNKNLFLTRYWIGICLKCVSYILTADMWMCAFVCLWQKQMKNCYLNIAYFSRIATHKYIKSTTKKDFRFKYITFLLLRARFFSSFFKISCYFQSNLIKKMSVFSFFYFEIE